LPAEQFATPLCTYCSLGIHESQSRMWGNLVGRSRSFWRRFFPPVRTHFGNTIGDATEADWHFAVNDVRLSLIRTESDEITYNQQIMLRFELELMLLHGDLSTQDLPGA